MTTGRAARLVAGLGPATLCAVFTPIGRFVDVIVPLEVLTQVKENRRVFECRRGFNCVEGGVQATEGEQVEVMVWRDVKRAVKGCRDGGGRKEDDERQKGDRL